MSRLICALLVTLLATAAFAEENKWTKFVTSTVTITPSDSVYYDPPLKSVYVGVSGDIRVIATENSVDYDCTNAPVFVAFPQGGNVPVRVWKVCATGTDPGLSMVGLTFKGPR